MLSVVCLLSVHLFVRPVLLYGPVLTLQCLRRPIGLDAHIPRWAAVSLNSEVCVTCVCMFQHMAATTTTTTTPGSILMAED